MTDNNEYSKNYYEVLGVDQDAAATEIKANYKMLLLQSHPDKQMQKNGSHSSELFIEIEEAWKVLSDPSKKKEYDAKLKVSELDQSAPVHVQLRKVEMSFDEESSSYTMDCRCGGEYIITEEQLKEGYDLIPCTTCTLLGQFID